MIEDFEFTGIWKGEYVYEDSVQPSIVRVPIPFVLRVKSLQDRGAFSGICQDDPAISKIPFPADIYGAMRNNEIFFVKRYPKTLIFGASGNLIIGEGPHPDIIY